MADLRIDAIYDALSTLQREAERAGWNAVGWEQRDRARDMKLTAARALEQYHILSSKWDRLQALGREADRQYDAYVTRDRFEDEGGCTCHISPPCGFCTRQTDEEEPS